MTLCDFAKKNDFVQTQYSDLWFIPWNTCPVKPLYVSYGMLCMKNHD